MKIIGITGGVGAGKSTVLDYLEKEFNARVMQADQDRSSGHGTRTVCCYDQVYRIVRKRNHKK